MMYRLLAVAVGGAIGSTCRYLLSGWVQSGVQRAGDGLFPFGTLVVNSVGCLVIGFLGAYFAGASLVREEYRLAILIGVLGGFTTFSTFAWETLQLATEGSLGRAILNVVLSNSICLIAVWIGFRLARRLIGA